ncbi:uncharacterized protein BKCO1_6900022 [Diplodia corticola]|uniref:RING-type domain-containing protein n=1 Tax=Diplodia corticola TaxID=236234 RepID=A0A1J9RPU9_9PEZI|nr:uncharacterized protein BKCO1_6900022 [Diplodia corticola]OJD29940.1 hypothetical protein BKCO1_6900022 [Diplodia corticola]
MASRACTLTFPRTSYEESACNACFHGSGDATSEPIIVLPCECNFHLACITLAFKTQHATLSFFTCPTCFTDLNNTGPHSRALAPPPGRLLQIQSMGDHNQVATFQDEDTEDITGHLVYRDHYDGAAGTLTVSISLVPENYALERVA